VSDLTDWFKDGVGWQRTPPKHVGCGICDTLATHRIIYREHGMPDDWMPKGTVGYYCDEHFAFMTRNGKPRRGRNRTDYEPWPPRAADAPVSPKGHDARTHWAPS
jgi:hypothetical protein